MMKLLLCVLAFVALSYAAPNCTEYCSLIGDACTGNNLQYTSEANCLAACEAFPLGSSGQTAGNTLGCREYHAGVAAESQEMADVHCVHAGPTGGNVCGTLCEAYCTISGYACNGTDSLYPDETTCLDACEAFNTSGSAVDSSGSTVQCRTYHAVVASVSGNAVAHCPHASAFGSNVCGSPCENYCEVVSHACTGSANEQYPSKMDCEAYCNGAGHIPEGDFDDKSGNTIGCRTYHATVASVPANAAVHCPHAGASGANVCGDWCSVYCQLVQDNCMGTNSQYQDTASCMTACAAFPEDGTIGAVSGNSVQCRIYHAGVAGTSVDNADIHCPHAGAAGGGVCVSASGTTGTTAKSTTGGGSSDASVVGVSISLLVALIALVL